MGENDGVRPFAVTGENRDDMPMMLQEADSSGAHI